MAIVGGAALAIGGLIGLGVALAKKWLTAGYIMANDFYSLLYIATQWKLWQKCTKSFLQIKIMKIYHHI